MSLETLVEHVVPHTPPERKGPAWGKIALIVAIIAGLAAAWRYTPLSEFVTAERVAGWADTVGAVWWAPIVVMLAYTPACLTMFPRPLITLFAVLAWGPVVGFVYSITGILGAAIATYFLGQALPRNTVRNIVGDRMNEMTEVLRRRGLLACFAMRVVPAAPFAVEGIAAGAIRIKLWHYSLGTVLGMLPGTLTTAVFGDQIQTALEDPSKINWWLIAGVVAFFVVLITIVRRWFLKQHRIAVAHSGRSRPAL